MDGKRPDAPGDDIAQARVNYRLPLIIAGEDAAGEWFSEQAMAENVTRRGAFIVTERSLDPGVQLALHDGASGDDLLSHAQVVWVRVATGATPGVGVKLVSDNERWMSYLVAHSIQTLEDDLPLME